MTKSMSMTPGTISLPQMTGFQAVLHEILVFVVSSCNWQTVEN